MASHEVLTALESLHRELEKLEPAIKHVETAQQITQTVKGIPQKHIELLKEVKDNDTKHKGELKDLFSKELTVITEENKKIQKTTTDIQREVKAEHQALIKLKETVQSFHERVAGIKFPERLDKLDANVAGIMAAVQTAQGRLESLERNILDRLKELQEYQKETRALIKKEIDDNMSLIKTGHQKHQMQTYITWTLIVLGAILIIII
jgi:chromosome segregation ATPase